MTCSHRYTARALRMLAAGCRDEARAWGAKYLQACVEPGQTLPGERDEMRARRDCFDRIANELNRAAHAQEAER